MAKILVISPHPDDAEFGVGAVIPRWVREGHTVTVAIVTGEGDLTMVHSSVTIPFSQRVEEQKAAATILGFDCLFLGLAVASKFDQVPMASIVTALDKVLKDFDQLYIPLPSYNVDHDVTWKACLAATRPGKVDHVSVFAYEELSNSHGMQVFGTLVGKKYIKVLEEDIALQREALLAHSSQVTGRSQLMLDATLNLHKVRGSEVCEKYATLVYPIREVI